MYQFAALMRLAAPSPRVVQGRAERSEAGGVPLTPQSPLPRD